MNELVVKPVEFLGDELVAIKNAKTGKMYTGVGYICKGIGFTKGQKDRQVLNIQNDLILNKGCFKFEAGVIDPNNEVLGIELDFLPLWLAKISITPKMKEEQPEVAEKLVTYQLKAKDVLAKVFIKQQIPQLSKELQAIFMLDERTVEIEDRLTKVENNTTIDHGQACNIKLAVDSEVKKLCCGNESAAYQNKKLRSKVYRYIWRSIKDYFNVTAYHNLLRKDIDKTINYISNLNLQGCLLREVQEANNQMCLNKGMK